MKTIGLLGGMSWESTASYYKALNEGVKHALGDLHSAKIILNSVDFAEIEKLQHEGKWDETANILSAAAKSVEAAGAEFLVICTNTMHKVADQIQQEISIPLLHIADATARELIAKGKDKVGLLGTQFTMSEDFYKGRLQDEFEIEVLVPDEADQKIIHDVIYKELCQGEINGVSRQKYLAIIQKLKDQGAEAIILGCTEIGLLVEQSDTDIDLFDTTQIHADAAIQRALN